VLAEDHGVAKLTEIIKRMKLIWNQRNQSVGFGKGTQIKYDYDNCT
jgi:hypothetical protein